MRSIYELVALYNELGFNCVVKEEEKREWKGEEEKEENETK